MDWFSVAERTTADISSPFPATPPFLTFCGLVDETRFILQENNAIGLDTITRNSSAVFKTWIKFATSEQASLPKAGWYANYIFAMIPPCLKQWKYKCDGYTVDNSPFRKPGKRAYITGFLRGVCNKSALFQGPGVQNALDFVPFVEITKIDWTTGDNAPKPHASSAADPTPSTPTTGKTKRRMVFNPLTTTSRALFTANTAADKIGNQSGDTTMNQQNAVDNASKSKYDIFNVFV